MTITEELSIYIGRYPGWQDNLGRNPDTDIERPARQGDNSLERITLATQQPQSSGFVLDGSNPWKPSRGSLKSGNWRDNTTRDGRQPFRGTITNATETMRLIATAGSHLTLHKTINTLTDFAQRATLNIVDRNLREPVVLEWKAKGAPGPQWALIYAIDVDVEYVEASAPTANVTIVIEREGAWRGVPPGSSPRLWSLYKSGIISYVTQPLPPDVNFLDINPTHIDAALVGETIQNRHEVEEFERGPDPTDRYVGSEPLSKNYLVIPKESIAGDAPALMMLNMGRCNSEKMVDGDLDPTGDAIAYQPNKFLITHHVQPKTYPAYTDADQDLHPQFLFHGAVGPSALTTPVLEILDPDLTTNVYLSNQNFDIIQDEGRGFPSIPAFLLRGRYHVYVRYSFQGGSGTGSADIQLTTQVTGDVAYSTNTVSVSNANAGLSNIVYMGTADIPADDKAAADIMGRGPAALAAFRNDSSSACRVNVRLEFSNEVNRDCVFHDVWFVPYDRPSVLVTRQFYDFVYPDQGGSARYRDSTHVLLDNSTFFTRGRHGSTSVTATSNFVFNEEFPSFPSILTGAGVRDLSNDDSIVLLGDLFELTPGEDNILVFFNLSQEARTGVSGDFAENFNQPQGAMDVSVDIVPRWFGVRDE